MRALLLILAMTLPSMLSTEASAQNRGQFEMCNATDRRCQTAATIALACVTEGRGRRTANEILSGWGLRVSGGRWEITFTDPSTPPRCSSVLTARPISPGGSGNQGNILVCHGGDRTCQRSGMVGLACVLNSQPKNFPTEWAYTGDGMRVVRGQWMFYGAQTNNALMCGAVIVADLGGFRANRGSELEVCSGDDRRCQRSGSIALSCDIEGDGFRDPDRWHYNGRSIEVLRGVWNARFFDGEIRRCENVLVAQVGRSLPPVVDRPGRPPGNRPDRSALPRGSVILYDDTGCPRGWSKVGSVQVRRSPVYGMAYCRFD